MSAEQIRCVTFDVDDTLYLERDYVRSGFRAVGAWARSHLGIGDFSDRAWTLFAAGERGRVFDEVLAAYGRGDDRRLIERLVAVYRSHRPSIVLPPDARACLEALHGRVALAAVTDGPAASQRAKVDSLGLASWLDPIVLTDALGPGRGKPDPAAFLRVSERTGVPANGCAYVADNPLKDFAGPASLGWRTVRIRRNDGLHADLPSGPEVGTEIETLEGVERVLAVPA